MNNITYTISENSNSENSNSENSNSENNDWVEIPLSSKRSRNETADIILVDIDSENCARKIDYDLNYTLKYLTNILEFYGIKKKYKLNKKETIEKILEFEMDMNNLSIVEDRKRLFDNFVELKNDKHFSKFILGSLN